MSTETIVHKKTKTEVVPELPNRWKVVMINDDVTPMELVVHILITQFGHSPETAREIMLEIHNTGAGVAGTYSNEIAEQKCAEAISFARNNGAPLNIIIEEDI